MSRMVTMRARKLRTCQLSMSRWSAGRWPTSAGKRTSFHGGPSSVVTSVKCFPICAKNSWVLTLIGPNLCFQCHWKKSRGCCWVSCTCSFFWQLQSQRHWHWWWHSAAGKRFPVSTTVTSQVAQQCQTVRPLAVVTDQPVWFLHAGNAGSSQSAPDDSNAVGVLPGCRRRRLSSSVTGVLWLNGAR